MNIKTYGNINEIIEGLSKISKADLTNYVHGKLKKREFQDFEQELENANVVVNMYNDNSGETGTFIVCGYNPDTREILGKFYEFSAEEQGSFSIDEFDFMELLQLALNLQ